MTATVPLPAGTATLYAEVGGAGATFNATGNPAGNCHGMCPFTFGGGAIAVNGGYGGGASTVQPCSYSDLDHCQVGRNIAAGSEFDQRLVVAGGGGGASSRFCTGAGAAGGHAGDPLATGAGAGSTCGAPGGNGGFGGTAGGASDGTCGQPGSTFHGLGGPFGWDFFSRALEGVSVGIDAEFTGCPPLNLIREVAVAGGGGSQVTDTSSAGGGGAGSSYWVPGATGTSMATDTTGVSQITISYTDVTAPTSTIALAPAAPDGNNGWYVSTVHATASAADEAGGSGVAETRCALDPASVPASFGDLPAGCAYTGAGADIGGDGEHVLYAASKDAAGNTETPVSGRSSSTPPGRP